MMATVQTAISAAMFIAALITLIHTISTRGHSENVAMERRLADINRTLGVLESKVDTLSDRVDKHNNLIERVYRLEADDKAILQWIGMDDTRAVSTQAKRS